MAFLDPSVVPSPGPLVQPWGGDTKPLESHEQAHQGSCALAQLCFGVDMGQSWGCVMAKGGPWGSGLRCPKATAHSGWDFTSGDSVRWSLGGRDQHGPAIRPEVGQAGEC